MLYARTAVGVLPLLLQGPVVVAESLVEFGAGCDGRRSAEATRDAGRNRAEVEVAFV